jgi:hypothetical protein
MRRLAVIVVFALFAATMVFAQGTKESAGTVDSISPVDPLRGDTEGRIVVIDRSGNAKTFYINPSTKVTDDLSESINSADIEDGDRVKVAYADSDTGSIALSICRVVDASKLQ